MTVTHYYHYLIIVMINSITSNMIAIVVLVMVAHMVDLTLQVGLSWIVRS